MKYNKEKKSFKKKVLKKQIYNNNNKKAIITPHNDDIFDDSTLIKPVLSTLFYLIICFWSFSSALSSNGIILATNISFNENLLLSSSDYNIQFAMLSIFIPLLLAVLYIYHAYEGTIGQNVTRTISSMISLYFYVYNSSSNNSNTNTALTFANSLYLYNLANTCANVLIYTNQNSLAKLLENIMHTLFLSWFVLFQSSSSSSTSTMTAEANFIFITYIFLLLIRFINNLSILCNKLNILTISHILSITGTFLVYIGATLLTFDMFNNIAKVSAIIISIFMVTNIYLVHLDNNTN